LPLAPGTAGQRGTPEQVEFIEGLRQAALSGRDDEVAELRRVAEWFDVTPEDVERTIAQAGAEAATQARETAAAQVTDELAARLEAVLESTTDCVVVLDRAWRLTYLNGRARSLLAGGREIIGRGLREGIPAAAGGAFEAAFRRAAEDGMPASATASLGGPEGPWFAADAFPTPEGLTVFLRDVTAATRAERALREGEARLQAVLDHVPVGVLLAEAPSGRVVLANRRAAAMLGVPALVGAGGPGDHALHPAFDEAGRPVAPEDRPVARALAGEGHIRAEHRHRRADDGRLVWIRTLAAPILDAGGRIAGAVAALADIDAERRQEEALRESELRFRTLAEAVPQIVWSGGPDGAVDYVNPRFFEFTGAPPGRGLGDAPLPIHPEDRGAARAAWRAAMARGEPYEAEYRLRRADGAWRWFVARGVPARGEDGAIRRWIGTANDVTELVETRQALERQVAAEAAARQAAVAAAEALAASEARFRGFAEASPDVLWILDPAGDRLEHLSPAYERLWGEPAAAAAATAPGLAALTAGLHPGDRAGVEAALARLRGGEPVDVEYRARRGDAQLRWVRLLSFPMRDRIGRVGRVGGFARDVTARREADERQRLLIGELNHRVKNTLATVLSLARQTARRTEDGRGGAGEARPLEAEAPGAADTFLADFQARLMALARGHDLLTASTWRGAMLEEVAAASLLPWRGAAGDPAGAGAAGGGDPPGAGAAGAGRIALCGPPVWLGPRQALGLALAIHEMATNAAKHGALGAPQGRVALAWRRGGDWVELGWTERGGPPVRPPGRRGFGTRLLRSGLATELGPGSEVSLDYPPEGFRAMMRFRPLPEGGTT
jgi:PAS domain S-box-containing protein